MNLLRGLCNKTSTEEELLTQVNTSSKTGEVRTTSSSFRPDQPLMPFRFISPQPCVPFRNSNQPTMRQKLLIWR